ncbi:hypothetical protein SB5544_00345 [Klebsiella variicola]|nr:hypothetical protein SB5544_00345 [Klebsiella variicola]
MASRRMFIAGRRCACTSLRQHWPLALPVEFVGPVRRSRHRAKMWRMASDAHCRAALRLHRPTTALASGPSPSCQVRRPGKAQPPPGKTGVWRRMPIAGRRCACTGLRQHWPLALPVEFVGPVRRSRHRAKMWRLVPDVHCRAALRLHRPTTAWPAVLPLPVEFVGPVRRSRHRAMRSGYQSSSWPRMRNIS